MNTSVHHCNIGIIFSIVDLLGVPLNVIDYRCFWKVVSAMQKAEYQVNSTIIELDWAIGE